jgi:hypothetical protein
MWSLVRCQFPLSACSACGERVDVRIVPADANGLFAIGSERGGHFGNGSSSQAWAGQGTMAGRKSGLSGKLRRISEAGLTSIYILLLLLSTTTLSHPPCN